MVLDFVKRGNFIKGDNFIMRDYTKPKMEAEEIQLKDCIAVSNNGNTKDGESGALEDIIGGILS